MNGWNNPAYVLALVISNLIALLIYYFARKIPRIARLLFFLLFAWAACTNLNMAMTRPQEYVSFADLAFLGIYKKLYQWLVRPTWRLFDSSHSYRAATHSISHAMERM